MVIVPKYRTAEVARLIGPQLKLGPNAPGGEIRPAWLMAIVARRSWRNRPLASAQPSRLAIDLVPVTFE